jgi:hypothetical protein
MDRDTLTGGRVQKGKTMTSRCWSIRIAIAIAVSVAAPLAGAAASCDALEPCAAKACRLDAEIAQLKAKGKTRQLAALERARAEMVHCNDDGLKQKRKVALEQAQRRIDRREAELKKAEASGDAAKVKKAQRNLESARKAYAEIEKSPL